MRQRYGTSFPAGEPPVDTWWEYIGSDGKDCHPAHAAQKRLVSEWREVDADERKMARE